MSLLDAGVARLREAGVENPRKEARLLLSHALGLRVEDIMSGRAEAVTVSPEFDVLIARRAGREPLAYVLERREFWSLDFYVGPGVLIPRPETEALVSEALSAFPDKNTALRAIDLGVGSGCILLSFLHERPAARGIGVDVSHEALRYAKRNADALRLADRVSFVEGDWSAGGEGFDILFSNPPYIAASEMATLEPELGFEPVGALVAGADGLDAYRQIAVVAVEKLSPGGFAFVELGLGQGPAVESLFAAAGLELVRLVPDLAGIPRCLVAQKPR